MAAPVQILVIGPPGLDAGLEFDCIVQFSSLAGLATKTELIGQLEMIVAPLMSEDADALEIIEKITAHGFRGRLRVLAPPLPNRQLVLRELRAEAEPYGITLELVEIG